MYIEAVQLAIYTCMYMYMYVHVYAHVYTYMCIVHVLVHVIQLHVHVHSITGELHTWTWFYEVDLQPWRNSVEPVLKLMMQQYWIFPEDISQSLQSWSAMDCSSPE